MATLQYLFTLIVLVAVSSAAPKKPILKIPEECIGKGFCRIKPEGYDEMEPMVNKLLDSQFFAQNFGDRIGDNTEIGKPEESPESDWHNCPYVKTREKMYLHSENGTAADMIIQFPKLEQINDHVSCAAGNIKSEIETEECFQDFGLSSLKMKSKCETTTSYRNYFVYDYANNQIVVKALPVPCCCTCKISSSL